MLLEKFVCLNQEAVELVAVRLLDHKGFFKKRLPLSWQLSFDQMSQDEKLLIFGTLNLQVWHLLVCEKFVVLPEYKGSLGLLEPLNELKVHDIVDLIVSHHDNILGLDDLDPLLVEVFLVLFGSSFNLELILYVMPSVKEENV